MNHIHHIKLYTIVFVALGLWVGSSFYAPEAVLADNNDSDKTDIVSEEENQESEEEEIAYTEYKIKPGDYLESIAESHDIKWPTIYEHNEEIENPDLIYPDQEIEIPSEDLPLTRSINGVSLVVPEDYAPEPIAASQPAPEPSNYAERAPIAYSTPQPTPQTSGAITGVPGLSAVLNSPYVYGGNTPAGFDCSGLTQYLAGLQGRSLPRTAADQYYATSRIGQADLRAGDLVFFNWNHVGMYVGGGQVVHALNPAQGIRVEPISTIIQYNGYLGAGRL